MGTGETAVAEPGAHRHRGILTLARRLRRDRRGSTLIEFSFMMLPFLILLFGIAEVGLVTWGTLELENATEDASRLVRTGQAKQRNLDSAGLKQEVCARVSLLFDCNNKLRIDLRSSESFGGMTAPSPLDGGGNLKQDFSYTNGAGQSAMLMTTFYEWPLQMLGSLSLSNMANGHRLLRATAAFRNEPFPDN
jgi:Flp pilus assembly protein TadG